MSTQNILALALLAVVAIPVVACLAVIGLRIWRDVVTSGSWSDI